MDEIERQAMQIDAEKELEAKEAEEEVRISSGRHLPPSITLTPRILPLAPYFPSAPTREV